MRPHSTPWPATEPALDVSPRSRRGVYLKTFFFSLFSIAFVLGGLYFGLIFLRNVSLVMAASAPEVVARFEPPAPLGRLGLGGLGPSRGARGNPGASPQVDQRERVTVLLLGIDRRPGETTEPSRTDTMLLATYDPATKSAAMLSIPRDLWVPIPISKTEVIQDRINTAHLYGELYRYPGGGPALAKATVEYNLGVKVHHAARIDFEGFEQVIDTVGGITVDVPTAIKDDEYPTPDYGTERIYFPAGLQHLNGERALKYARTRHADSDLGRVRRQQQVLLAFREQALRLNLLPQAPQLIQRLGNSINTDLSLPEMIELARYAQELDTQAIVSRALEPPLVTGVTSGMGADILLPNRPEIAKVMREIFFDGRLRQEGASVEVVNATGMPALGNQAVQALQVRGIAAGLSATADTGKVSDQTEILDQTGKPYTAGIIADLLKVNSAAIRSEKAPVQEAAPDAAPPPDIRIVLGRDATVPSAPD